MSNLKKEILEHPRNENILFEEDGHKYTYLPTGERWYGVTSLIKNYAEEFDAEKMAKYVARRDGMTQDQVLNMWDEKGRKAIEYGNAVHEMIESSIMEGVEYEDEDYDAYLDAIDELGIQPLCSEWVIYDERIQRASAIDGLFEREGKVVLVDFKTNEDLEKVFKVYKDKRFFYPIGDIPDSKYYKYVLQLNIYRKIVDELYPEIPLSNEMWILHIREGKYEWLPVLNFQSQINKLYEQEFNLVA